MDSITVKEDARTQDGTRVHVVVVDGNYDRWVDASDWDADPEAIVAAIAKHLNTQAAIPQLIPTVDAKPVTLSAAEVDAKLAQLDMGSSAVQQ